MKTLIVEDDFVSRRILQSILSPYGTCDIAVNGREALMAFLMAWDEGEPYDLICLDIMMPGMDGHETLRRIREIEQKRVIKPFEGVKIIITTALSEFNEIKRAFENQCDSYLIKPITKENLIATLEQLGLIVDNEDLLNQITKILGETTE